MKLPLTALMLVTLAACSFGSGPSGADVATPPSNTEDAAGTAGSSTDDATTTEGTSGAELKSRYLAQVCKLYTEPACVTSQKDSCATHLGFPDMATCTSFMDQTASTCTGLEASLAQNKSDVEACMTQLAAADCAATPVCDSAGKRLDVTDKCAKVAAIIAACDPDPDTGL